jgi:acetyl-CoA carboxylase carboxyl transferase subunit beta
LWTQKKCAIERCDGKTKLKDAVRTGVGKSKGKLVICCGFCFYRWFYGSCSWRKKSQEELITQLKLAFVMISKSGGARMMEAAYSLMQLAKHI